MIAGVLAITGCGIGESGIAPPVDRIFFPASVAADPTGDWLYVVNSNSDLRYNSGTVIALDLRRAREDRARGGWGRCPRNNFIPEDDQPLPFCCRDYVDDRILNCAERAYVEAPATVRIGSFGGAMLLSPYQRGGETVRRLYVAVRAEPSITVIDATLRDGRARLQCTGEPGGPASGEANPTCAEAWKVREGEAAGVSQDLPEEPNALTLDPKLGILYVGHLSAFATPNVSAGGISVVDTCAPHRGLPRLSSVTRSVFAGVQAQAVTDVAVPRPGDPLGPVFATARFTADVAQLRLRGADPVDCAAPGAPVAGTRSLELVPSGGFFASPFTTRGADLRAIVFSPDETRAYVLHRQFESRNEFNPPALLIVDRRPNDRGEPANRPTDVIEVCRGPNRMKLHDAGRGPRLFVNCFEGGQVYVIDPALPAVQAIIEAGNGPADLVFSPTDRTVAYVASFVENAVAVLDLAPGSPTEYRVVQRLGFPRRAAASRDP